jgi:X-X-X-Leu-X-X-Gly heptad repeat protein
VAVPTDVNSTTPSVLKALALAKGGVDQVRGPLFNDLLTLKALTTPPTASAPNPNFDLTFASMLNSASPTFDAALATWIGQLSTDLGTAGLPAGVDPAHPAGGALAQVSAGLAGLITGVGQITTGLNAHLPGAFGATDKGGIDYGLLALLDPKAGLPAAVAGIDQLFTGSVAASTGADQLAAGSGTAATGANALDSGLGQIATGTAALTTGLGKLSAGQHQVATGLPAAVSGTAQIADGLGQALDGAKKVHDGIGQTQTGAFGPLGSQLTQASQNGHKQLAVLTAAGALASKGPGGLGASWVLTQNPKVSLAADVTKTGGSSHTGRNVGIGVGGLLLLLIGLGSGLAMGRQRSRTTA